ncbi:integrase catalytic domain-containing protein [Trichonephila clavipes]|nr:integrase catalytic domain-containing protein [Trichonephila clavipes]
MKVSQNTQSQTHRDNNLSWQRAKRNEVKYNCERVATANELFVYDSTSNDAIIDDRSYLYEKNSDEIHLLIGADYAGKLLKRKNETSLRRFSCCTPAFGVDSNGTLSKKDCRENRSKTETQEVALNNFRETLDQDSTGRYKVNLPWLEGHPPLPDSKELAQKRLKNTVKSLKLANQLYEYQEVFNQWEREGVIEPIHGENDIPGNLDVHYLPHRAIFKDNSTTKVLPVFDGSAKMRNFVSINECIEKGPNLIEMIPAILNRFSGGKSELLQI